MSMFSDITKRPLRCNYVKNLEMEKSGEKTVILGYLGVLSVITRTLRRDRGMHGEQIQKDMMTEEEFILCLSKDGRSSHEGRNTGSRRCNKGKEKHSSLESPEEIYVSLHLHSRPIRLILDF